MILIVSSSKSHCYLLKNLTAVLDSKKIAFKYIQLYDPKTLNDITGLVVDNENYNKKRFVRYLRHYHKIKSKVEDFLSSNGFKFVILANDIGYIEKRLIKVSKKLGMKSILFEDGNISIKSRNSISHNLLYILYEFLIIFNLHDLASNRMGGFGCDIIITKNEKSSNYFNKVRRKSTILFNLGFLSNLNEKGNYQNLEYKPKIFHFLGGFEQSHLLNKYQEQEKKIVSILNNLCKSHEKQIQLVPHPDSNIISLKTQFPFATFNNKSEALNSINAIYFTYSSSVIFEIAQHNKEVYCIDFGESSHLREYLHSDNIIKSEEMLFNLYNDLGLRNELYLKIQSEILKNFPTFQIDNFLNLLGE